MKNFIEVTKSSRKVTVNINYIFRIEPYGNENCTIELAVRGHNDFAYQIIHVSESYDTVRNLLASASHD
jgi:hypothetical protein